MSFRYTLEIIDEQGKSLDYLQLFGNNDFIKELHEFAKRHDGLQDYEDFCVILNNDTLNELYTVVDNCCLNFAKDETYRKIDVIECYNKYYGRISFGESLIDLLYGNYYTMQSARLYDWLFKSDYITGLVGDFEINGNVQVKFEYF